MSALQKTALVITIIGALNWGLVGLFDYDLIAALFGGDDSMVSRTLYTIVGIAGLVNIGIFFELMDEHE